MKLKGAGNKDSSMSPLDTFFLLLTAKANVADIDLGLLTEATMLSMQLKEDWLFFLEINVISVF